jgi:putative membrane protein
MTTNPADLSFKKADAASQLGPVEDPRVYLAAERTLLAWVRTSLALMGFGFVIARFAILLRALDIGHAGDSRPRSVASAVLGFVMACMGVVVIAVAAFRHLEYVRALERGVRNPPYRIRFLLILAAILVLVGVAIAIHILLV